jgi:C_GCAxxG_C_C family probable redox protein
MKDKVKHMESVESKISRASSCCEEYRLQGFHCSESTLRACAKVLGFSLSDDVLRTACGFRGGGGGYGDRCGVLEAGCMLISYLYGRLHPGQKVWPYSYLIRVLHKRFDERFQSIYCRDLLPIAKEISGKAQNCSFMYTEGAAVVMGVLLEAGGLLEQIPPEERR